MQRQQWWSSSTNEHGIVEFYKRARVIGIVCAMCVYAMWGAQMALRVIFE